MRFDVEIFEPELDAWKGVGSVLLPRLADDLAVEGALAALGVYAPRGADELDWGSVVDGCIIYDADGTPMVRLEARC